MALRENLFWNRNSTLASEPLSADSVEGKGQTASSSSNSGASSARGDEDDDDGVVDTDQEEEDVEIVN